MADISAAGPIFAAGFQAFSSNGWELLFMPDINNDELQRNGKPACFHWLANNVRLAQKENGDYKFSFIHFEGIRSSDTNVGVTGTDNEVAGGLLGFSTTSSPPAAVLADVQQQLLKMFQGKDDKYWGIRSEVAPEFRPAQITSNQTTITNISPNPDGSVPSPSPAPDPNKKDLAGKPRSIGTSSSPLTMPNATPRAVPRSQGMRSSNLNQWYFNLQGQGNGSITPFAENAYSGLVGSLPAALIWSSFHGGTGGISVWQKMKIKVWSPAVHLRITGDWDRIQAHLSAAGHYGAGFWQADLKAEFNAMVQNGDIEVLIEVDTTLPNADKMQEALEKRSDLIFQKFMDAAQKTIFDPVPFKDEPAQASGGIMGFGGGAALKLRTDLTHLRLNYEETRELAYLQEYPISGQLEGLYDVIKTDPSQEKKYFTTLYLSDWERKVARTFSPVVNWADPAKQWAGEPVAFLSAQVGYPNTQGVLEWDGHMFTSAEGPNAVWNTAIEMKALADVANPPQGWTPDKTFIKRSLHFMEAASQLSDPYTRAQVEQQVVELDPGDNGRLVSDINLEVRVDEAGTLSVGPITLDATLDDPKQVVEVTFQALGKQTGGSAAGQDHDPVKFTWNFSDQDKPRYWMLFTGDPDFVARYQYQVHCIVKHGFTTKGMEWTGPWTTTIASGPVMVSVPMPDDPGVVKKDVPLFVSANVQASDAPPHTSSKLDAAAPPTTTSTPPPVGRPTIVPLPPVAAGAQPPPTRSSRGGPSGFKDVSGWTIDASQPDGSSRDMGTGVNGDDTVAFSGFREALS